MFGGVMVGMNAVLVWLYLKDLAERADIRAKLEETYKQRPDLEKKLLEISDRINSISLRIDSKR